MSIAGIKKETIASQRLPSSDGQSFVSFFNFMPARHDQTASYFIKIIDLLFTHEKKSIKKDKITKEKNKC